VGVGAISPNICESVNAVMDEFSVVMGRPRAGVIRVIRVKSEPR
jgi:hypothetical protein